MDTSKYQNSGTLNGKFKYEESDCPIEQGEEGKVKKQYAMYFRGLGDSDEKAQVVFKFKPKSTLALGFGEVDSRRKCFTIEMWIKPRETRSTLLVRGKNLEEYLWILYVSESIKID